MAIDFSKYDTEENLKQIRENANKVVDTEFDEVPPGTYEVALSKLELTKSKKGNLMVVVWYTILSGDYENQKLFQYQVVSDGDKVRMFKSLLEMLSDKEIKVEFTTYAKYAELLDEIMEFSEENNLEYSLKYDEKVKDGNVYKTFKILEVFEG